MDSHSEQTDVVGTLQDTIVSEVPDADGPVQVLRSAPSPTGGTDYEVSASRLVPIAADDPDLTDAFVAVPVIGHVSVAEDGTAAAALDEVTDDTAREVRAWAQTLIASGSVAGVAASAPSYGPPGRPTHELVEDSAGRRVLRRIGFAVS